MAATLEGTLEERSSRWVAKVRAAVRAPSKALWRKEAAFGWLR